MGAQVYVLVATVVLAVVAVLATRMGRGGRIGHLTPLAGIAFAFVIAGALFGDSRLLSYGLIGAGIALAVVDIVRRLHSLAA